VFVTAFDQYAVEAFRQGAIDYVVKPIEAERLLDSVQRLQVRLRAAVESRQPTSKPCWIAWRRRCASAAAAPNTCAGSRPRSAMPCA
jgi:DNA-binding LytR/AlgR family response regulator